LFRVCINDPNGYLGIGWILEFSFDKGRNTQRRLDIIDDNRWLWIAFKVELIKNLTDFRVDEAY
jgi:hypothetical protein